MYVRISVLFFFFGAQQVGWDGSPCLHLSGYDLFADNESSLKHFGAAGPKPRHLN